MTTAWIPGNFLNEGLVTVDAAVCSIDSPKLHHHVSIHEAVSFHVQDPLEGDSSRGMFTGPVARRRPAAARLDDRGGLTARGLVVAVDAAPSSP